MYNEATEEYEYLNSEYDNMKAVAYMLDTEEWNTLYKDTQGFAEYTIGGATLKMYAESYNATHDSDIEYQKDDCGYMFKLGNVSMGNSVQGLLGENREIDDLYVGKNSYSADEMYLASPISSMPFFVVCIENTGSILWVNPEGGFAGGSPGLRPVIALASDVSIEQVGEGENITFNLKK